MQLDDLRQRMREFYRSSTAYQCQLAGHEVESSAYYVNWVTGFIPANSLILDLGCGTGLSTHFLRETGHVAVGADLSELFIETHRARGMERFVAADALDLPFASGVFDAVASAALIEHLPDVAQALGEMLRVLKPDGLLLILAPNHCSLTMPVDDLFNLMGGGTGRPYFAETPGQAVHWLVQNLRLNVTKMLTREVDFHYVEPNLTVGSGGDHDMVYYASPIDLRRFLHRQGATIVSWSGVKSKPLVVNGSLALRGSGIRQQVMQSLLWPFAGMTFVVARKTGASV